MCIGSIKSSNSKFKNKISPSNEEKVSSKHLTEVGYNEEEEDKEEVKC